jgi:aminoglycoside phosphotransferase (APT) family kinase protein
MRAMPQPKNRDLEDTRRRLEAWFARQLPEATDLEVRRLRGPSDTGFSSDTLMLELARSEAGASRVDPLVVRIQPRGFNVFPSYDLTVQYRVMDALAKTDVPVPRMLWHEWSDDVLDAPFYAMEHLDGWVPSDNPPMHTAGRIAEVLAPAEREAVWWSGLEAMIRVHALDPFALGLGFLEDSERGETPLDQHLRYYDEFFAWGMGEASRYPLIVRSLDWLRRRRPPEAPTALCWGDSRLGNQIFSGTTCIGVIDWEMCRLGDPLQDLAWWLATDRCFTEGIDVKPLEGFPGRDETVARWEAGTGRSAEHLDYYEVFALARFSVIMARLGLQMKHYEVLPQDHDMDVVNLAALTLQRKLAEVGA